MTISEIEKKIKTAKPNIDSLRLMQTLYRYCANSDKEKFLYWSEQVTSRGWLVAKENAEAIQIIFKAHCDRARAGIVHDFMIAIEFWKKYEKKFYEPRMYDKRGKEVLRKLARHLQDLFDGVIMGLSISMPPRTGKSELGKRFTLFCMGHHPDMSILFASHTNPMVRKFYNELLQLIDSPEYSYKEIFSDVQLVDKSAEDSYIDMGSKATYKTFYARSIDSNMSGVLEASFMLYCDDLIRNSEEARNPERVQTAVIKYVEDIRQRRVSESVRELHIGTRWNQSDIIGILEQEHFENDKWRFIKVPALDENDESNFNYEIGALTTEHFKEQRRIMYIADGSDVSFSTIFQQEAMDREGIEFPLGSLSFYDSLPEGEPERAIAAVDCAFGGADYFSMPIGICYGQDVYIDGLIYVNKDRATKDKTLLLAVNQIKHRKITAVHVESNNGGEFWADNLKDALRNENIRCAVTDARVPTSKSKNDRIIAAKPEIQALDPQGYKYHFKKKQDAEYALAMQHLTRYNSSPKYAGKQIDDFPDSLASMAANVLGCKPKTVAVSTFDRRKLGL